LNAYKTRKVLIIGAGEYQVPAIIAAKKAGYFVVATDISPDAPGFAISDVSACVDIKDVEGTLSVARAEGVEGVVSVCVDYAVPSVAYVAQELGLVGLSYEAARVCRSKRLVRERLKAAGLSGVSFETARRDDDLEQMSRRLSYPVIVKPEYGTGSKGVTLVGSPDALPDAVIASSDASAGEDVLIEEYVPGPEVSVEGLIYKGRVNIVAVTDKIVTPPPFFVEIGHTVPSVLPISDISRIKELSATVLNALAVNDTAFHIEMKITPDGPKLIEVGCRLGGGTITTDLVPLATGVDMVAAAVGLAMGEEPSLTPLRYKAAAVRFLTPPAGRVVRVGALDDAYGVEGVKEIRINIGVGDIIYPLRSSADRMGHVIALGENSAAAAKACEEALKKIAIETVRC